MTNLKFRDLYMIKFFFVVVVFVVVVGVSFCFAAYKHPYAATTFGCIVRTLCECLIFVRLSAAETLHSTVITTINIRIVFDRLGHSHIRIGKECALSVAARFQSLPSSSSFVRLPKNFAD